MADMITECKERVYDFSWLPEQIGDFKLVVDTREDDTLGFRFFHYENDLGWRWEALYDKEVSDFTVHIHMPLFSFVDINFIRNTWDEYESVLRERGVAAMTSRLVEPQQMFTYAYKQKGLPNWACDDVLPLTVGDFTRHIAPSKGISMINGSFIIAEYCKAQDPSGLLLFYNVLRDEFFVELRRHNYPEINHDFDAVTIPALEEKLTLHLTEVLLDLENRL